MVAAGALPLRRAPFPCGLNCGDADGVVPTLKCRLLPMTIPFGEPEPSDSLLHQSVATTRLRIWLTQRLRQLAVAQRIQDARALRREFSLE